MPQWTGISPRLRILKLRILEFRPEGETTCQTRATPWEPGFQGSACPERAPQFSGLAISQSPVNRILFRPFRARAWLLNVVPGRCPGLICDCPLGATTQRRNIKTCAVGLVWPIPLNDVATGEEFDFLSSFLLPLICGHLRHLRINLPPLSSVSFGVFRG